MWQVHCVVLSLCLFIAERYIVEFCFMLFSILCSEWITSRSVVWCETKRSVRCFVWVTNEGGGLLARGGGLEQALNASELRLVGRCWQNRSSYLLLPLKTGPSPRFSSGGGAKTKRRGQKPEGGPHFENTILDVCSNIRAKREMGGTDFKWGSRAPLPPPLATAGLAWKKNIASRRTC